jgi:hypothetical protein
MQWIHLASLLCNFRHLYTSFFYYVFGAFVIGWIGLRGLGEPPAHG